MGKRITIDPITRIEFLLKVKAGASFNPQEYYSILRI